MNNEDNSISICKKRVNSDGNDKKIRWDVFLPELVGLNREEVYLGRF